MRRSLTSEVGGQLLRREAQHLDLTLLDADTEVDQELDQLRPIQSAIGLRPSRTASPRAAFVKSLVVITIP